MSSIDASAIKSFVDEEFTKSALPSIIDYIKIPNLSRSYDVEWATNGLLEKAANHIKSWIESQALHNIKIEYLQDPQRTPLLFIEVQGTHAHTPSVLLYGHFDKQPHLTGWDEGLGPVTPVIKDGKLYGRGGADDGYSAYAAILSIKACQVQKADHPRCVIVLEADEESGSQDLPHYLTELKPRIGEPSLIICLDSGAGDYERLWLTTSLRGVVNGTLMIKTATEEIHSGDASGVIPSTFRVLRKILDRVDCVDTGYVDERFQVNIPPDRYEEAFRASQLIGKSLVDRMPLYKATKSTTEDLFQLILNRIWKSQLTITGIEGLPAPKDAGNVLKPYLNAKLSLRIPPTLDEKKALENLKSLLENDPPYNAEVIYKDYTAGGGFNAPTLSKSLKDSLNQASLAFYGKEAEAQGEGGSIPFMGMLAAWYQKAEFAVVGVLGPNSNAHAPNEFLHLNMCKSLIACMAKVLADSSVIYKV